MVGPYGPFHGTGYRYRCEPGVNLGCVFQCGLNELISVPDVIALGHVLGVLPEQVHQAGQVLHPNKYLLGLIYHHRAKRRVL